MKAAAGDLRERADYARFVDRFFDHNLSGFFGLRDSERELLSAAQVRRAWERMARGLSAQGLAPRADFYLGIPFCARLCRFCNLSPEALGSAERVSEYLGWLREAMRFFAPAFSSVRFRNLLVGGGTPSVLTAAQLDLLFSSLFRDFRFHPEGEKSFEFHPSSFSADRLEAVRRHGFNRLILGVQSMTPGVLRRAGRSDQSAPQVGAAVSRIRAAGFPRGLNIDLILGLEGETPASFLRSFSAVARLAPEEISVYLLKPFGPHMARRYGRSVGSFYENSGLRTKFASVPERMTALAEKHGYSVNESPLLDLRYAFVRRGVPARRINYSDTPLGGNSLFGLGSGARSHVRAAMSYECGPLRGPFDPGAALFPARTIDLRNEMLRFVSHHLLSAEGLSRALFREVFGCGIEDRFGGALRRLSRMGAVSVRGGRVRCTAAGMRERLICRLFFVGLPALRRMLDAHNSPENQIRIVSAGVEYDLWVERIRPGQEYVSRGERYGLQFCRPGGGGQGAAVPGAETSSSRGGGGGRAPAEQKLVDWVVCLFSAVERQAGRACAPERTFLLHELIGRRLAERPGLGGFLELKPWIPAADRSGLGYVREAA